MNEERAKLLDAPLDPSRVQKRSDGRGHQLDYLAAHDVIRTANRIFGFGGWGHDVVALEPLGTVEVSKDGKQGVHVGYRCTVRLTVDGCVPVCGVGFGDATEYRQTARVTAQELAMKEAESDALKRAFKNFGDQFGLVLYAKGGSTSPRPQNPPRQDAGGSGDTDGAPNAGAAENGATLAAVNELQALLLSEGFTAVQISDTFAKRMATSGGVLPAEYVKREIQDARKRGATIPAPAEDVPFV